MSDYVIEAHALSKRFGHRLALDHLELQVPRGGIHAVVGANGAGKSTLFRILLGFLSPSTGEARILGRSSQRLTTADRERIGFVNEEHTLPNWSKVGAVSTMYRRLYSRWDEATFANVLGNYHISRDQRVGQLSRGERAGFNLALVLAQMPELLILDEPTLGLDVVAKRAFLESLLHGSSGEERTVIYCSHQMDEIERVADNLIILERGQLKHMSAPEDLCARVTYWVADIPFKIFDPTSVPGLLQTQRIDGLQHFVVLDQDESFGIFLRARGARNVRSMSVSLERAINSLLAKNHSTPAVA